MSALAAWPDVIPEDPRAQLHRRYQQRRCLVCGARRTRNQNTSYFCARHYDAWRYCSTCATLRPAAEHGKDSRCRSCANARSTAQYRANPDRSIYRLRLKAITGRKRTTEDMIFAAIRRQIALAALVRATPGWSWERRGRYVGHDPTYLAEHYRRQQRGPQCAAPGARRS